MKCPQNCDYRYDDDQSQAERKMMAAGISGPEGHAMAHPEVLYCIHLKDGDDDLLCDHDDHDEGHGTPSSSSIMTIGEDEDLLDKDDVYK